MYNIWAITVVNFKLGDFQCKKAMPTKTPLENITLFHSCYLTIILTQVLFFVEGGTQENLEENLGAGLEPTTNSARNSSVVLEVIANQRKWFNGSSYHVWFTMTTITTF